MKPATGFPAIVDSRATVLILGSLPSRKSIEAGEYYAHPQNAFWRIMGELVGAGPDTDYASRTALLQKNNIAVWDVLASSIRPGSLDSEIEASSAVPNDFLPFLRTYSGICLVCFNGQKAAGMFEKMVLSKRPELRSDRRYETLPSTSPAYASMTFEEKLRKWSVIRRQV